MCPASSSTKAVGSAGSSRETDGADVLVCARPAADVRDATAAQRVRGLVVPVRHPVSSHPSVIDRASTTCIAEWIKTTAGSRRSGRTPDPTLRPAGSSGYEISVRGTPGMDSGRHRHRTDGIFLHPGVRLPPAAPSFNARPSSSPTFVGRGAGHVPPPLNSVSASASCRTGTETESRPAMGQSASTGGVVCHRWKPKAYRCPSRLSRAQLPRWPHPEAGRPLRSRGVRGTVRSAARVRTPPRPARRSRPPPLWPCGSTGGPVASTCGGCHPAPVSS